MLIRKVSKVGASYGVLLPKSVFQILEWDVKDLHFSITLKDGGILLKPVKAPDDKKEGEGK